MIAVTGATGFIGKRLVQKLINRREHVRCIVRRRIALDSQIQNLEFFYADLNSPKFEKALNGAEIVLHLAAEVSSDRKKATEANIDGLKNIIAAAKASKVKRFVFVSSELAGYSENNFYGKTKMIGEKMLKDSGLNYVIFRPTLVFGPGDNKNLTALMRKVQKLPFVPVIGRGSYKFQPVFVDDVADAILASLHKKKILGKTFELGGPEISFRQIMETFIDEFHWKKPIINIPKKLLLGIAFFTEKIPGMRITRKRINEVSMDRPMDIGPAEKILGFKPIGFRESLKRTMREENWA